MTTTSAPPTVLSRLTAENIGAALAEFDRVGREAFLVAAGFKPSTRFMILRGGKTYDIKAVAGRAVGAAASTFSSGAALVRKVESLGFKVVAKAPSGGAS